MKTAMSLRALIEREMELVVFVFPETDIPYVGNCMASGDEKVDRRAERWIEKQLANGNEWAWCRVEVRGKWKGLSAVEHLGGCSYRSEKEFKQKGGYYDDMVSTVVNSITEQAEEILDAAGE